MGEARAKSFGSRPSFQKEFACAHTILSIPPPQSPCAVKERFAPSPPRGCAVGGGLAAHGPSRRRKLVRRSHPPAPAISRHFPAFSAATAFVGYRALARKFGKERGRGDGAGTGCEGGWAGGWGQPNQRSPRAPIRDEPAPGAAGGAGWVRNEFSLPSVQFSGKTPPCSCMYPTPSPTFC